MQGDDMVEQEDSIWTTSDVNAYHEACACGNLQLTLLENGRLVSSTMLQNPDPHYALRSLSTAGGIMGDYEPNITIRDTFNSSNTLMLLSRDNGSFAINHLTVE